MTVRSVFFWQATHQQIYRELSKLEKQELITAKKVEQSGRPNKKHYSMTQKGKTILCEWIRQPSPMRPTKDEFLIKLFKGNLVPLDSILKLISEQRLLHEEALETYFSIEKKYFSNPGQFSDAQHFQYLTLRNGIYFEQGWLKWCDEAIASLNKRINS